MARKEPWPGGSPGHGSGARTAVSGDSEHRTHTRTDRTAVSVCSVLPFDMDRSTPHRQINPLPVLTAVCLGIVGSGGLDPPACFAQPHRQHERHRAALQSAGDIKRLT
jgi:hypothetical protein